MASSFLAGLPGTSTVLSLTDLTVVIDAGVIAWVVFDLKDRGVNVVNMEIVEQVEKAFELIASQISSGRVKAVVFSSGKPGTFIAGADIDAMYPNVDMAKAVEASSTAQKVFVRLSELKALTIACINGAALGAGLELALACDYRFCSDSKKVQLGLPEVKLGLLPGAGGTVRLAKLIGLQGALEMILAGGSVRPEKAKVKGLVDGVIPEGPGVAAELSFFIGARAAILNLVNSGAQKRVLPDMFWTGSMMDRLLNGTWIGQRIVARQAAGSLDGLTRGKYPAPYLALDSVVNSLSVDTTAALQYEAKLFAQLAISPESKSLMSLYYMMESVKKTAAIGIAKAASLRPVTKIGIIGAGVMGAQIATLAVCKDFRCYMRDLKPEFAQAGLKLVTETLDKLVAKKRCTAQQYKDRMALISVGTGLEGFADCDVVIEAAVERMDLKQMILAEVEAVLPEHAVFATNTSSLSVSTLAAASKRPRQVCGMHFFNPVPKMPLVEVIRGKDTHADSVTLVYKLALDLGKTPCICGDGPGFIVNRILGIYMNEAGILAMEGTALNLIDDALLDFGMPMGPFRLMDEVGLDVAGHVGPILEAALGARFKQSPEFGVLLKSNPKQLGKKTGAGFYIYDKSGKTTPTSLNSDFLAQIAKVTPAADKVVRMSQRDLVDRCILVSLQEACHILADGICSSPAELDLAMVMGTGFAPFRGGLLNYADQRGISAIVSRLKELYSRFGSRFNPHPMLLKMAAESKLFFPDRPHGMIHIDDLPRSGIKRSNL